MLRPFHSEITTSEQPGNFDCLLIHVVLLNYISNSYRCSSRLALSSRIYDNEMTNQIHISHSLYTPILGYTILLLKGWHHGWVHVNCQPSLSFHLMFKNCAISLISCRSSVPDSLCSNTLQLRNNNNIAVCFKQIKRYKKVFSLNFVTIPTPPKPWVPHEKPFITELWAMYFFFSFFSQSINQISHIPYLLSN